MNSTCSSENHPWSTPAALRYYESNRSKAEDIYPSERVFLVDALQDAASVLDIGCAAGGFSRALREIKPDLVYTGVDVTPAMIDSARSQFSDDTFQIIDGRQLPFPDDSFDVAICFGVLHMTTDWRELLAEGWRVCRKALLFDLRLTDSAGICNPEISYQKLAFDGEWNGESTAPYIVLNYKDALETLRELISPFGSLQGYGYNSNVSGNTVSPYQEVCMAAFCLAKDHGKADITRWDIPFPLP